MSGTDPNTFDPTPLLMWGPDEGDWEVRTELYGYQATPRARRLAVLIAEATVIDGGRTALRMLCDIGSMVYARSPRHQGNPDLLRAVELAEAGNRDALEHDLEKVIRVRGAGRPLDGPQAELAAELCSFGTLVLGEPAQPLTAWDCARSVLSHAIESTNSPDEADALMESCADVVYRHLFYSRPLARTAAPKPRAKRTKAKRTKRAA